MESFLDLNEICEQQSSSYALKLVPWLNWDEWVLVKDSLFSDSPDSIAFALKRISAWESRGCLPAAIEATASIIEIRQIDPYCRVEEDRCRDTSLSEKMLAHLYCMAIIRLVNGVIEKTRKKEEKSIAVAAEAIGIPRLLIDIRHEGSHRGLPALQLLRSASVKALDWLKSYYWESQSKAIPFERDGNAKVRKKIKSKLRELSFCLKSNQSSQSNSPILEGKRSKKQVSKISKSLVQLYSSYSSEIVGVLLEYLLEALSSSELVEHTEQVSCPTINIILPDWKVVILRFCDKEPELLLNLFKEVLIMIETQEAMKYEEEMKCLGTSRRERFCQIDRLASLFAWLAGILYEVLSAKANVPKNVLLELVRKCLRISAPSNKQLVDSALLLAKLMDDSSLMEKVKRLSHVILSNSVKSSDESSLPISSVNFLQMEEYISRAARKLELFKQRVTKSKTTSLTDCDTNGPRTWTLAKEWNPCPIGMLPRTAGSSGYLPSLDHIDDRKEIHELDRKETQNQKPSKHGVKRDATLDLTLLDDSTVKKKKETGQVSKLTMEAKGCLLIDGIMKNVTEQEFRAIKSSVRILI
ncbi:pre-rRNA-processing protein las1-like isoform X2 [Prosopis cineraria]|uniref:pre-rRNA-processing protein las1-like isoform X2 n=1 Tax=Prosopis cineraria TaxID=364024 RepID=UPI00240FC0C5|nr:pre-rRNA-processing protein las1-like isoform X2 [Prosopis cineraria]